MSLISNVDLHEGWQLRQDSYPRDSVSNISLSHLDCFTFQETHQHQNPPSPKPPFSHRITNLHHPSKNRLKHASPHQHQHHHFKQTTDPSHPITPVSPDLADDSPGLYWVSGVGGAGGGVCSLSTLNVGIQENKERGSDPWMSWEGLGLDKLCQFSSTPRILIRWCLETIPKTLHSTYGSAAYNTTRSHHDHESKTTKPDHAVHHKTLFPLPFITSQPEAHAKVPFQKIRYMLNMLSVIVLG